MILTASGGCGLPFPGMRQTFRRGITLIELIVAVILFMVVIVSLNSINTFSHFHIISSSRRAKLQNEVSMVLDHMQKKAVLAVGNEFITGADTVVEIDIDTPIADKDYVSFYIDADADGTGDRWISYRYDANQIQYCGDCEAQSACNACKESVPGWNSADVNLAENIVGIAVVKPADGLGRLTENSIDVTVDACWDPSSTCNTVDNPTVNMTARIFLPSVSTH